MTQPRDLDYARTLARIPLGSMRTAAAFLRYAGYDELAAVVDRQHALYECAVQLELERAGYATGMEARGG